tara:strand:- start:80 stop:304 length:225 start_codon:yes stop_codon:yes gene_type:complete
MFIPFRKFINLVIFNFSLFLVLIIGIQNSSEKRKVNFIFAESIDLPVSFIIGVSFITGSISSSLLVTNLSKLKE